MNRAIDELKKKAQNDIQNPKELVVLVEDLNDIQPDTVKSYDAWWKDNSDQATDVYFCQ
jgi:hypothetical protein